MSGTTITIPAGPIPNTGPDCVTITPVDDDILERSEGFDLVVSGTDLAQVTVGVSDTTTVNIEEDDGMLTNMTTARRNRVKAAYCEPSLWLVFPLARPLCVP